MFAAVHQTSWKLSSIPARCWFVFRSLPDRLHNKLWKVRCPDGSPPMHSFVKDGSECIAFLLRGPGNTCEVSQPLGETITSPSFWWCINCFWDGQSRKHNISVIQIELGDPCIFLDGSFRDGQTDPPAIPFPRRGLPAKAKRYQPPR